MTWKIGVTAPGSRLAEVQIRNTAIPHVVRMKVDQLEAFQHVL
jgi:hypothetical protein